MKKTIVMPMRSLVRFIAARRYKPAPATSSGAPPFSSAAAATDVTVPGSAKSNRYDTVRMRLVFAEGEIIDVQPLQQLRHTEPLATCRRYIRTGPASGSKWYGRILRPSPR
jgi:hypothetical protein